MMRETSKKTTIRIDDESSKVLIYEQANFTRLIWDVEKIDETIKDFKSKYKVEMRANLCLAIGSGLLVYFLTSLFNNGWKWINILWVIIILATIWYYVRYYRLFKSFIADIENKFDSLKKSIWQTNPEKFIIDSEEPTTTLTFDNDKLLTRSDSS